MFVVFLEAWISVKDTNAGNDGIPIPDVYIFIVTRITARARLFQISSHALQDKVSK